MRILMVEDDQALAEVLVRGLQKAGDVVDWVSRGQQAWTALHTATEHFDLLVLDLGLPDGDGLSLLRKLRNEGNTMPTLILTARDALEDRVSGLDAGADDYLVKPFELAELQARLRALGRRQRGKSSEEWRLGPLRLDPGQLRAWLSDADLQLNRREFMLLRALAERSGQVITRSRLEEQLYGWGEEVESNTLEVHIHHLRKKLGKDAIRTVRGVGYRLELAE
ncbi:DNA-binding response regulator [Pokkaliibacter plantistimulans]|uniref:DNA-binding response regulator n=1 Tax=Proteobacteria bacterium 228 TaxID=2083153 RepID=A0A2S5KVF4_9PROT|nr:response regulator [Pokkaliibacter plantistimulans]PPC78256.1 DNA-binding response regulator [Pokkaliibacter plantistimulans]